MADPLLMRPDGAGGILPALTGAPVAQNRVRDFLDPLLEKDASLERHPLNPSELLMDLGKPEADGTVFSPRWEGFLSQVFGDDTGMVSRGKVTLFQGRILLGNNLWEACKVKGLKVPVEEFIGTEEEATKLLVAHKNRSHLNAREYAQFIVKTHGLEGAYDRRIQVGERADGTPEMRYHPDDHAVMKKLVDAGVGSWKTLYRWCENAVKKRRTGPSAKDVRIEELERIVHELRVELSRVKDQLSKIRGQARERKRRQRERERDFILSGAPQSFSTLKEGA